MGKLGKKIEETFSAVAFAEAGEVGTARALLKEAATPSVEPKRAKSGLSELAEKHATAAEAVTFAEAGEHQYAREILAGEKQDKKKLLVVGGEEGFSEVLISYTLAMAERMRYSVVALNVVPMGNRLFSFLGDSTRKEMETRAQAAAEPLIKRAAERGVELIHNVKFGDTESTMKQAHKEYRRVAFILTEPDQMADCKTAQSTCIPVFSLADAS